MCLHYSVNIIRIRAFWCALVYYYSSFVHRAQERRALSKYTLIMIPGHLIYAQKLL